MRTNTEGFHTMRGHVTDGCEIVAPNGKVFTLKRGLLYWAIVDDIGNVYIDNLDSAYAVEDFVVNTLGRIEV